MTKTFVRGPGMVVARIDVGLRHVALTWDAADVVVNNHDRDVTLRLSQPKELQPVATDAIRLADAVYAGDETAALALADEVQLQRTSGSEYVHRDELLAILRRCEWCDTSEYSSACPICDADRSNGHRHGVGCRLGKALGRVCDIADEPDDHADDYASDADTESFPFA